MFGLLRLVRGVCGFIFALQFFQVIQALAWVSSPEAAGVDMGKFFALLLIKVFVLIVSGLLFFGLRKAINWLHIKMKGAPHPALAKKTWAL